MIKQKIAILTFYSEQNYGAVLQTYALCAFLKLKGYDPFLINRPIARVKRLNPYYHYMDLKFRLFRNIYLPTSTKKFRSKDDFLKRPIEADIYIVGSDQVWNKEITKDEYFDFFLWFAPPNSKLLSYAASFGSEKWLFDYEETILIKEQLNKFKYISVREESASILLKQVINIDSSIVLDPTFLLDNYNILSKRNITNNYLVCIKLAKGDNYYQDIVLNVSKKLNLVPIEVCGFYIPHKSKIKIKRFVSVKKWLSYIKSSSFIITDSYHGTVFSIIFKRNFVVIPSNFKRLTRIKHLLQQLGILDRLFENPDSLYESKIIFEDIDYNIVTEKLNFLKKETINELSNILNFNSL